MSTILITGSTDGIGKKLAERLIKEGHTVLLHGRNPQKLEAVRAELAAPQAYCADLSTIEGVFDLSRQILREQTHIDVLLNNAGIGASETRQLNADHIEIGFMVSVLAPYILGNELAPLLAHGGRIINTSSYMHNYAEIGSINTVAGPLPDFALEQNYSPARSYNNAKLYAMWLSRYQARHFKENGRDIAVYSYHPGLVATKLTGYSEGPTPTTALPPMMVDLDEGIKTAHYLCTSTEIAADSGQYIDESTHTGPSDKGYSPQNEKALIDYCNSAVRQYLHGASPHLDPSGQN
ncbi:MAG: SDR family NAD(P)-dependent oxidoreductase [Corynebacterium sp.]|nr:SDR family NAD(P)-dependent oxidoreductase [Corynebacterium sp.]